LKQASTEFRVLAAAQRVRSFRTFAMNVSQIYDGEAMEPVELKIELEPWQVPAK
jgi:hypothetical protein